MRFQAWDFLMSHMKLGVLRGTEVFNRAYSALRPVSKIYPHTYLKMLTLLAKRSNCEAGDTNGLFAWLESELEYVFGGKCITEQRMMFMMGIRDCINAVYPTESERRAYFKPHLIRLAWFGKCSHPAPAEQLFIEPGDRSDVVRGLAPSVAYFAFLPADSITKLFQQVLGCVMENAGSDVAITVDYLEDLLRNAPIGRLTKFDGIANHYKGSTYALTGRVPEDDVHAVLIGKLRGYYEKQGKHEEAAELVKNTIELLADPVTLQAMGYLVGTKGHIQQFRDDVKADTGEDLDFPGTSGRRELGAADRPGRRLEVDIDDPAQEEVLEEMIDAANHGGLGVRGSEGRLGNSLSFTNDDMAILDDGFSPYTISAAALAQSKGACEPGFGFDEDKRACTEEECPDGFYSEGGFMACTAHSVDCAKLGRAEISGPTDTADAICGPAYACVCTDGTPALGVDCPEDGLEACAGCNDGYYLDNAVCSAYTVDCEAEGRVLFSPASSVSDAVCGDFRRCTCEGGTGAAGVICPRQGDPVCSACDVGRGLEGTVCVECEKAGAGADFPDNCGTCDDPRRCGDPCDPGSGYEFVPESTNCSPCAEGTFSEGGYVACSTHSADCTADGLVYASANTVKDEAVCGDQRAYTCENGTPTLGVACAKDGKEECWECNDGYYLNNAVCFAYTSVFGGAVGCVPHQAVRLPLACPLGHLHRRSSLVLRTQGGL